MLRRRPWVWSCTRCQKSYRVVGLHGRSPLRRSILVLLHFLTFFPTACKFQVTASGHHVISLLCSAHPPTNTPPSGIRPCPRRRGHFKHDAIASIRSCAAHVLHSSSSCTAHARTHALGIFGHERRHAEAGVEFDSQNHRRGCVQAAAGG